MKNRQTILHLSLIDGIGPVTIKRLVQKKPKNFDLVDLYKFGVSDLIQSFSISKVLAEKIFVGLSDKRILCKELFLLEKHKVQWTAIGECDYPKLLNEIYAPPSVFYWKGEPVFLDEKTIAIVGSRKAHRYAEQSIESIVPILVKNGWTIISGGAIGADSMAHREAIRAEGRTVVVLGSGLLHPYPVSNKILFDNVLKNSGALVSIFPLQTKAQPGNFPARNRIIAGLSRGCVVVQAAEKSGARITAQFALEQAREVFAIPGPINDSLSIGCNNLIREGATLINCGQDIIDSFSFSFSRKTVVSPIDDRSKINEATQFKIEPVLLNKKKPKSLSIKEKIIMSCCPACSTDDLSIKLSMNADELYGLLFDLQVDGKIKQNFAGLWEKI